MYYLYLNIIVLETKRKGWLSIQKDICHKVNYIRLVVDPRVLNVNGRYAVKIQFMTGLTTHRPPKPRSRFPMALHDRWFAAPESTYLFLQNLIVEDCCPGKRT